MIPSTGEAAARFAEPAVLGFELEHLFGTADDQLQHIDIDRLLIEIVGAESDRPQRMLAGLVAGRDDDLCRRRNREDFGQCRQPLGGSVRIGRKPEIEDGYRDGVLFDEIDRFLARSGGIDLVVGKGPAQLPQEPCVIIDDQQRLCDSAAFRLGRGGGSPPALFRRQGAG